MENANTEKKEKLHFYQHAETWTKEEVKQFLTEILKIDQKYAEILYDQDVTGSTLKLLTKADLVEMGIPHGPAIQIIHFLKKHGILTESSNQTEGQEGSEQSIDGEDDEEIVKNECKKKYRSFNSSILQDSELEPVENKTAIKSADEENVLEKSPSSSQHPTRNICMPHPFDNFSDGTRYIKHHILNVPETGPLNLIDPAHEFKLLSNTENALEEDIKMKFSNEVFRFAAACMNSRTNGTIHFGIRDNPHGEIEGIKVTKKEAYIDHFNRYIEKYFDKPYIGAAKACIREPRFVEVLLPNETPSDTFVIEIDVVPRHSICNTKYFCTNIYEFKSKCFRKAVFIRDGASSKNIKNTDEFEKFKCNLTLLADSRKRAEEEYNLKQKKTMNEGLKLISLLTGNRDMLDDCYYDYYILVTNKCHPSQTSHLDFLQEIKWFAVLDFDPESEKNGVFKTYQKTRNAKLCFPYHYENKVGSVSEQAEKLNLHQETNWIFCNGIIAESGSDFKGNKELPLDHASWQRDRAAEVRKMISFLSHKDVKQSGKFLIVFLLLSRVEDPLDPLAETFVTFYQELKGLEDMACICIGAGTDQRWKDLLHARGIREEALSNKCVSNLTLEMVNGTIIKAKSVTQSSKRLLPSIGGSTILLKKEEDFIAALEILCENECKDTEIEKDEEQFKKFMKEREKDFYRGGRVTWWNFYFSSENYTSVFVKRDRYENLEQLIVSSANSANQSPVKIINLYHHPGCGGTTLAMHILWNLRKQFRCAVLKNKTSDFGTQVATLITYGANKNSGYLAVLLLVDDFEEQENVYLLQNEIQAAITEKCIPYVNPLVIVLNCMRSQNPDENATINSLNSISLKQTLSEKEQRAFEQKLKDIEKMHPNPDNFYSFMIMKKNFDPKYIEKLVKNTLRDLNINSKSAQLVYYLTLLNAYVRTSTLSISLCEEFLGINSRETGNKDKLIEKMGICSNILMYTRVQEHMTYRGLRIIHTLIAQQCLTEFKLTYNLPKSEITLRLLKEDLLYENSLQDKLTRDIITLLITRQRREHGYESDTWFSPLIEAIHKEEKYFNVECVLKEASTRFKKNSHICQALARYFYIKENKYDPALVWAKEAKNRAPRSSYISDTLGQVFKRKLRCQVEHREKSAVLTAEELDYLLELAQSASSAFRKSQQEAKTAAIEQNLQHQKCKRKIQNYNTLGYQGEIETGLYIIDVLQHIPFFSKEDSQCRKRMIMYLSGNSALNLDSPSTESEVLKRYSSFLKNLRSQLKRAFDFLEDYFVFFKTQTNEREIVEAKMAETVRECFTKYTKIFCDSSVEQLRSQRALGWPLSQKIEAYRMAVEASKADSFSGLLAHLYKNQRNADREIENIVYAYAFLCEANSQATLKEKQNFILANVVLNCIKPESAELCHFEGLRSQLVSILEKVELNSYCVEPFFLASLLFWPENRKQLNEDSRKMDKYVRHLCESFKELYGAMCCSKQPVAHFYLAKGSGLNRFVHKRKIDQLFSSLSEQELNVLWQNGNIWKEKVVHDLLLPLDGRAEGTVIYINYGINEPFRIPVKPVPSCLLKNGPNIQRVSFYLGFSIAGLLAYNVHSL